MTEDQIKHMASRFLQWRLPEDFYPDGGISFARTFNENTAHPMKAEPVGTNLFTFTQAEAMIRHMLEGLPQQKPEIEPGRPTEAVFEDGEIVIRLPANYLPVVVNGGWGSNALPPMKITDETVFAKELTRALNDEEEDGTTPIHRLFDAAILAAAESGAEGIEDIDEDEAEEIAASLASLPA